MSGQANSIFRPKTESMMTPASPAPAPAIVATGLRKSFGDQVVLDGIDLTVAAGTVFSLLGPNGAGKTTMVQILSTLIRADGGEIRVAGHDLAQDPDAVRAAIGVTGQYSAVDKFLTGEENLILMADLHHLGRAGGRRRAGRTPKAQREQAELATRWAQGLKGRCGGRLLGEWLNAAPAERYSAKAILDAARGTQPHRPVIKNAARAFTVPGSPETLNALAADED
jgi:hypothetical protein